jgi:hypothetical protein
MFQIKILEKEVCLSRDFDDLTIGEALETIYPNHSIFIILWNEIEIELSYGYDMSMIIRDIKQMFDCFNNIKSEGDFKIFWGSSSFMTQWNFIVKGDVLTLTSYWTDVKGDLDKLRDPINKIILLNKGDFIAEWKMLLKVVMEDLESVGYNEGNLDDFNFLKDNT